MSRNNNITTGSPHFAKMGHTQSSQIDDETKRKMSEAENFLIRELALQTDHHILRSLYKKRNKDFELGVRLGGDCITAHLGSSFDWSKYGGMFIRIALGGKPDIVPKWGKGSTIRHFQQHTGAVECIDGIEDAEMVNGVQQIVIVHGIGEDVTEIDSSGARMGFVITQDKDAEATVFDFITALNIIKVKICQK